MNMFSRKNIFCVFLILFSLMCYAAEIRVRVQPENITLADNCVLVVELPVDADASRFRLPQVDGITWNNRNGQSRRISFVNGRRSGSLQLQFGFNPDRSGKITIPALSLTGSDGSKLESEPLTFTVGKVHEVKQDKQKNGNEAAFITLTPAHVDRKVYYDGEEVPLHLNICVRTDHRIGNPELHFSAEPERSFLISGEKKVVREMPITVDGYRFYCYVISVKGTVKGSGQITVRATADLVLQDDEGFFGRRFRKKCSAQYEFEAATLPDPPADAPYTDVSGTDFRFETQPLPDSVRAGEPVTIQLKMKGNADWEKFRLTEQKIPAFRSYPPETSVENGQLTLRQTLIPLQSGSVPLKLAFSVFDTATGKYRVFTVEKTLHIEKGSEEAAAPPVTTSGDPDDAAKETQEQDDVYYLIDDTGTLTLPLWRNALMPSLILILSAILLYTALYFLFFRKKLLAEDPAYLRKRAVRSLRKELLHRLDRGGQPSAMTAELMEYLTAALDLPPGASLSEAAGAVEKNDPAFAAMLRDLAADAWAPVGQQRELSAEKRKKFRSSLMKLSLFLLVFLLPLTATADDAADAYDDGRFHDALKFYLQRIQPGHAAASDLYNAGNCYCQLGDYARGLVMYERALKLAPQNGDIRANRDFLRRRFELREKDQLNTPADLPPYLMRLLRVDQWIIAGVAGAILAFGSTGFFFIYRRKILIVLTATGALLLIISAAAAVHLHRMEENETTAIIVTPGTKVYSLPSENGTVKEELGAGCEVYMDETRHEWIRIRVGEDEGWVHRNDLLPLKVE